MERFAWTGTKCNTRTSKGMRALMGKGTVVFHLQQKKSVSRWTKCSCADETHTPREIQCGLLCINKFQIECLGKINKNLWWEDNYNSHLCLSLLSITGVEMIGMLSPEHDFFHSQICSTLMMLLVRKKINFKQ